MKTKQIYILVTIEERNGEQEYTFNSLQRCKPGEEEYTAQYHAANWYDNGSEEGEPTKPDLEDIPDYYEFEGGSLIAKVRAWKRISNKDAATLRRLGVCY